MGELRKFYSISNVVFVGRSLVDLGSRQHGSDMIEPAALAKPVIAGPFTANFDHAVRVLKAVNGLIEVHDQQHLIDSIKCLLASRDEAIKMGRAAQAVVRSEQGATQRHVELILETMSQLPA
jgi:3-deoxy-D-manno-octulosonic-acid transferase